MKTFLAALFTLGLTIHAASADDISAKSVDALIDDLTAVNDNTIGLAGGDTYDGFLAGDEAPRFEAGVLPVQSITVNPVMRELVRRGAVALPTLIAHLDDGRLTRLQIGLQYDEGLGGQFYADEYDPRIGTPCGPPDCTGELAGSWFIEKRCLDDCRAFEGKYTVKVGDVCEVIIGQIVNRSLSAVEYQPTNFLYVNSPIEYPSLIARIKKDWGGVDSAGLEASLLDDIRVHPRRFVDGAFTRLRFYYPKTYAALRGKDLEKRNRFEADKKAQKAK